MKPQRESHQGFVWQLPKAAFAAALFLCSCFFLYVALQSFFDTTVLTREEQTLFHTNSLAWQMVLLSGISLLLWVLTRAVRLSRSGKFVLPLVLVCTAVYGSIWIYAANVNQMGEPMLCSNIAIAAANGDWFSFRPDQYLALFPFQCGFIGYLELLYGLIGQANPQVVSYFNLAFVCLGQWALYHITKKISPFPQAQYITAYLMLLTWPWVLYTTFNYGTFPALALTLCAFLALLHFMQTPRLSRMILPVALLTAAMLLKNSTLIPLLAMCIVLGIEALRRRKGSFVLCMVLLCVATSVAPWAVQKSYQVRSGCDFGAGTPKIVWISMGLEEGPMAMGWYNGKTYSALPDAGFDPVLCTQQQQQDIAARMAVFSADPAYAKNFFMQKINSQWIDPTFASITTNFLAGTPMGESRLPALTQAFYTATYQSLPIRITDALQTLVYAAAALGLLAFTVRKDAFGCVRFGADAKAALLAITALGGFLYLLISEGKSQYALSYYLLLLPYAAHGLCTAWHGVLCLWRKATNAQRAG